MRSVQTTRISLLILKFIVASKMKVSIMSRGALSQENLNRIYYHQHNENTVHIHSILLFYLIILYYHVRRDMKMIHWFSLSFISHIECKLRRRGHLNSTNRYGNVISISSTIFLSPSDRCFND